MTLAMALWAIAAALVSGGVVGAVVGFRLGRRAAELDAEAELERRLQEDEPFRLQLLEHVAQLAGAKVELAE